jgi:hypothetical protein
MAQALRERLIGAWKLESYVEKPVDGSAPFYPMGDCFDVARTTRATTETWVGPWVAQGSLAMPL